MSAAEVIFNGAQGITVVWQKEAESKLGIPSEAITVFGASNCLGLSLATSVEISNGFVISTEASLLSCEDILQGPEATQRVFDILDAP